MRKYIGPPADRTLLQFQLDGVFPVQSGGWRCAHVCNWRRYDKRLYVTLLQFHCTFLMARFHRENVYIGPSATVASFRRKYKARLHIIPDFLAEMVCFSSVIAVFPVSILLHNGAPDLLRKNRCFRIRHHTVRNSIRLRGKWHAILLN